MPEWNSPEIYRSVLENPETGVYLVDRAEKSLQESIAVGGNCVTVLA
jgi:hypothetical protein